VQCSLKKPRATICCLVKQSRQSSCTMRLAMSCGSPLCAQSSAREREQGGCAIARSSGDAAARARARA
jgi:hypothetical protein